MRNSQTVNDLYEIVKSVSDGFVFLNSRMYGISGISAGVPKHIEYNKDYPFILRQVRRRNTSPPPPLERRIADPGVCSSDLLSIRLRNVL